MDVEMAREIQSTRAELGGNFCRGCGYCMPCPADIPISMAARMSLLLRRAPWRGFTTPEWKEKMRRVNNCVQCGQCAARCPYELDTPALLRTMLEDYENFLVEKGLN
jgi:predicted aldo/keto reductase-like oxidoreductase